MNRKDIFMTGFKSKLGFSFTHKDMEEFETIIDFYEKENARLKDKIENATKLIEEIKLHYQQSPTMIPNVKINKLEDLLKEN